jgi:hypothetical protein
VTSRAVRLRSSLLSALFLLGALGFPLADGALFHVAGHDPFANVTHVEATGGTHHADRCTLAQPVAPQQESLGSAEPLRVPPPLALRIEAPAAAAPCDADTNRLQHSRAPPA